MLNSLRIYSHFLRTRPVARIKSQRNKLGVHWPAEEGTLSLICYEWKESGGCTWDWTKVRYQGGQNIKLER